MGMSKINFKVSTNLKERFQALVSEDGEDMTTAMIAMIEAYCNGEFTVYQPEPKLRFKSQAAAEAAEIADTETTTYLNG